MGVVPEFNLRLFQLAATLHVNVLGAVDQDIADRVVLKQKLQRAQAERLVEDLFNQTLAFGAVEEGLLGVAEVLDDETDLAAENVPLQLADLVQVELVHEFSVDLPLEEIEFLRLGGFGGASGGLGGFCHGVV